jgi:ferredoxin--NADP+ reductase
MSQWVEGVVVDKRRWNENLYSLRIDAQVEAFEAGQFIRLALDIDGERVARPYSFVNPPQQKPLEIHFNQVPGGLLSARLSALRSGDCLWVSAKPNGFFTATQLPPSRDLWLVATGTALGVYLSILRTDTPWRKFENLILVHGVRHTNELSYRDEISALPEIHRERLRVVSSLSRDRSSACLHGRITDALEGGCLEKAIGLQLSPEHSHVMLCGSMGMIREVSDILKQRALRRHRRHEPGHFTTEKYH